VIAPPPSIIISEARVIDVVHDATRATYLEVELVHHGGADPVIAWCRWCAPYAGSGYGDWFVPSIGDIVLCAFPGLAVEGGMGGDIDDGYAWAVIPGESRPPVPGLAGALSDTRRVSRGRQGEAFDRHVRGDEDVKIDGARTERVGQNDSHTVKGNESRETMGELEWLARDVARLIGDALVEIRSAATLKLAGENKVEVESDEEIAAAAPLVTVEATEFELSASASAQLESALVKLVSAVVELGQGTMRRLVDERLIEKYNTHQHAGAFTPPNAPSLITADDVCTTDTRAS